MPGPQHVLSNPRSTHPITWVLAAASFALMPLVATAEEGGSGHYFPGSIASFIDAVPPAETLVVRFNGIYYDGSAGNGRPIPIGGLTTVGAAASTWGAGLTILWRPALDLGEHWSYAMSTTIPFVKLDVSANVATPLPNGLPAFVSRSSSVSSLGDIVLMPLMLNYMLGPDAHIDARLAFYAPTGSYQVGRLANTGKNFWTTEPTVGFVYFGQKNGREASAYAGIDFNSENPDTHYHSGTQFHLDGTLAQHVPWHQGIAGLGLSAYFYQQLSGDSGSGATLGAFKAKTVGLGPALSYVHKIAGHDTVWELKWLHEIETEKRMQGDVGWLKAVYKWQ
jgi:hypothetical protein